jgi:NAD(P)-dependent dehydrogenase (short-subunit alcohol dehydrogenase family)
MRQILITGANRGIGLELVRQYLQSADTHIFATCRQPDSAYDLRQLAAEHPGRVVILPLDVTDADSLAASVEQVRAQTGHLDMLINNAGIYPGGVANKEDTSATFGHLEAAAMLRVFEVNTVAPVIVTQAYADMLRQGNAARVINVSSDAGSLTLRDGGAYSYPASKTALNILTRCLASDLQADGIIVVSVHPGFVQTEMGGPGAPLTPTDTVPSLVQVMDQLTLADTGQFFNWDGKIVPW